METTICFLNDKILALSGKFNGKNVYVNSCKVFELSEGSIINGVIINNYDIKEVLRKIKSDKTLFFKNKVSIILDSSLIYIKAGNFPVSSKAKMDIFAENEFVGFDSKNTEMIFDYSIIKKSNSKTESTSIVCYAVEKAMVKSFIDIFQEEGIAVSSIDISINCISKFIYNLKFLEKKTYVISNIDKNNITLILFVNNNFYYMTRARLFNDYGTEDFFQEISTNLSSLVQFNKSQRNGFDIESVYICGMTSFENMSCTKYISDLGIENGKNSIFDSAINFSKKIKSFSTTDFIYNLGSLIGK